MLLAQELRPDRVTLEDDAQGFGVDTGQGEHFAADLDHQGYVIEGKVLYGTRLLQ
jgi:hypothetical protein